MDHATPITFQDFLAQGTVRCLRVVADTLFAGRYGHRAVVLETIAGVPGMVGGMLQHLRSLRRMQTDNGWIHTLLAEAENERMHLMTFIDIARPTGWERFMVVAAQGCFFTAYLILYVISGRTAHRLVGYLEEEAVVSYTEYLESIDSGKDANIPAPLIAIAYWKLPAEAKLRDVVYAIREDEMRHRDVNHGFADQLTVAR